jgi:hypothetical protein
VQHTFQDLEDWNFEDDFDNDDWDNHGWDDDHGFGSRDAREGHTNNFRPRNKRMKAPYLPQSRMTNNFPASNRSFWLSSHEQTLQQLTLYTSQAQPGCSPGNSAIFVAYGNEQADV